MATYTPEQIRQAAGDLYANGSTYADIAQAAANLGIPLTDVYNAYGISQQQGNSLVANSASPAQLQNYFGNIYSNGGTFTDIANEAARVGLPMTSLYSAYGITPDKGNALVASQPLTSQQLSMFRNFVNSDLRDPSITANPYSFNGDFTGLAGGTQDNLLGMARALGMNDTMLAQALGVTPDQIKSMYAEYGGPNSFQVMTAAQQFAKDHPEWADPASMSAIDKAVTQDAYYNRPEIAALRGTGGGGSSRGMYSGTGNPYLDAMAGRISQQYTNTLQDQWLPALQSNAIAAGGLGGSRQGVAQGLAVGRAGDALSGALSNLYGGAYESDQNRALQQYGIDKNYSLGMTNAQNSYNLGMGNLGLGYYNAGNNYNLGLGNLGLGYYTAGNNYNLGNQGQMLDFYTAQRGQDLQGLGLAGSLYNLGVQGPWSSIKDYGSLIGNLTGNNVNATSNQNTGGGWQGLIGGALGGTQFGKNMGWWG